MYEPQQQLVLADSCGTLVKAGLTELCPSCEKLLSSHSRLCSNGLVRTEALASSQHKSDVFQTYPRLIHTKL